METAYKTKVGNRIIALVLGLVLIGVGALIVATGTGLESGSISGLCVVAGIFGFGALLVWVGLRPTTLVLTGEALEMRNGRRTTARYPYGDMQRVRMLARREAHRFSRVRVQMRDGAPPRVRVPVTRQRFRLYPELQIEGDFAYPFILQLDYRGPHVTSDNEPRGGNFAIHTPYDSHAVVKDLMSRLPAHVQVDPSVSTYAATGTQPDARALPEEMPPMPTLPTLSGRS